MDNGHCQVAHLPLVPPYSTEKLNIVKIVKVLLMVRSVLSLTHNAAIIQNI